MASLEMRRYLQPTHVSLQKLANERSQYYHRFHILKSRGRHSCEHDLCTNGAHITIIYVQLINSVHGKWLAYFVYSIRIQWRIHSANAYEAFLTYLYDHK